jgi:hypothetical protein
VASCGFQVHPPRSEQNGRTSCCIEVAR